FFSRFGFQTNPERHLNSFRHKKSPFADSRTSGRARLDGQDPGREPRTVQAINKNNSGNHAPTRDAGALHSQESGFEHRTSGRRGTSFHRQEFPLARSYYSGYYAFQLTSALRRCAADL